MSVSLGLAVLAVLALRAGFLYLSPFGACPRCGGTGHIQSGPHRPVCPRCDGRQRVQRRGSRTVHRLVLKIRHGQRTAARYTREDN
jgi:DnaJ-class molecular chaperone